MYIFILLLIALGYLAIMKVLNKKNIDHSFLYGFSLSFLIYLASGFLFFWFAVLRRMSILNIPFIYDSEVAFAMIIIPMMVAIPWLPFGIITGLISWKKGNKTGLRFLYIFSLIITVGLSIVFWNLPYN